MSHITMSDEVLAEKLRKENCDQFNTLVRMHLSFVLDLNTDESDALGDKSKLKKWIFTPFSKKSKQRLTPDGTNLTKNTIDQIQQLVKFLKKETNICVEGIFRRTGSINRQQELRNLLSSGSLLDLDDGQYNVHDCASVLKGFLADLPEPLLTEAHYPVYCQIANLRKTCDKFKGARFLESLQLLHLLLPQENRTLLKLVLELLNFTASYESQNKMSVENLATLYTPHLLCPRKLAPEVLHTNAQILSEILSLMILSASDLFFIPAKLAVDIRAYFAERERKLLSPQKNFDESISDNVAARTVFSFVDHVRTAKENEANPTERELAQLYAYIQALPESSKKKKLVKQFNKENGYGTPLQIVRSRMPKNRSIGDSIKKHIFHKSLVKSVKKAGFTQLRSSSEDVATQSQMFATKRALCCTTCEASDDADDEASSKKARRSGDDDEKARLLLSSDSEDDDDKVVANYLTSTPACVPLITRSELFTPENQERKSMSPITKSTQHMCRAMQETMMTPRSRKPVLVVSGTNIHNLPKLTSHNLMSSLAEEQHENISDDYDIDEAKEDDNSLTSTFREYLYTRSILSTSPNDASFSSRTDDYSSSDIKDLSASKLSSSLLHCLDGNDPENGESQEKELVLKPKQFDENGMPVIFETSF